MKSRLFLVLELNVNIRLFSYKLLFTHLTLYPSLAKDYEVAKIFDVDIRNTYKVSELKNASPCLP